MKKSIFEIFSENELNSYHALKIFGGGGPRVGEIDENGDPIGGQNNGDSGTGDDHTPPQDPTSEG